MSTVVIRSGPVFSSINVAAVGFDAKIARVLLGLDNALAIEMEDYYFYKKKNPKSLWDGKFHFFNRGTGKFPTGLMLAVTNFLRASGVGFTIKPTRFEEKILCDEEDINLGSINLRDYQIAAVLKALDKRRGILNCATNAGKTEIAVTIFNEINKVNGAKGLLLTHRKEIFQQTIEKVKERLGFEPAQIKEGGIKNFGAPFTVAMVKSLHNIMKKEKPSLEERDIMLLVTNTGVLFLDECHLAPADTWYTVAQKCEAPFRFGLSGTPFVDDCVRNAKLEAMTGPTIYKVTNKFLVEQEYSATPYVVVDRSLEQSMTSSTYQEDYGRYIVYNQERNRKIAYYCKKAMGENRKTLVMVRHIDHGDIIKAHMESKFIGVRIEYIHGNTDPDVRQKIIDQFKQGDINILISSMILKEGVNISNISCLIMAFGGEADTDILQCIGRALRQKEGGGGTAIIVDFTDPYGKYLRKHARSRQAIYKKEGFPVVSTWDELKAIIRKDSEK